MTILNDTHVHVRRGHGQLRRFVKAPDRNFPINSHTLTNIRPRAGGNNDIMDTAGLLAERRRLWVGERKRRHVCGVCVLAWETLAAAGGKNLHGIRVSPTEISIRGKRQEGLMRLVK